MLWRLLLLRSLYLRALRSPNEIQGLPNDCQILSPCTPCAGADAAYTEDMDYELAKKLKEAGYPQIRIGEHFNHRVGSHSDDYGGSSDAPCDCLQDRFPTLEELIQACGDEFGALVRKNGSWCAIRMTDLENADERGYIGKTPAEALCRLWLVLKSK